MSEKKSGEHNPIEQNDRQQELPINNANYSQSAGEPVSEGQQYEKEPCAIVGIGASAGGLESFTQLLEKLPNGTGMAFVLVQHMDPKNRSMLAEILSKIASIEVSQVENQELIKPDHVYIIPPGKAMFIAQGILNLVPRADIVKQYLPIDYFFESLARDQGSKAIGIVLSGTGADGSRGLQEIKDAGGITFAQKPDTAKYESMPLSAIATGIVDFILHPEEIALKLVEIARSSIYDAKATEINKLFPTDNDELNQIFTILRKVIGIDFSEYRELTIKRRVMRRMVLHKIEKPGDYINFLQHEPAEVEKLYQDILINVTSFFRGTEAFESLKTFVFPSIMQNRAVNEPVRVWVPGCSTGEEAYSLAILLIEFLRHDSVHTPIQIFATDINETHVEKARSGIYTDSIKADVSPERLRQFFVKVDQGYQVTKTIRDMCVFARQNMVKDPPFPRLDLISCRNAIIYFGPAMQKRLFPVFHYALKPKGFLFLGSSESVGEHANLFKLVEKKHRIYSKKAVLTPYLLDFAASVYTAATTENCIRFSADPKPALKFNVLEEADRIVLDKYAPAGVIINSDLEIIQFRGRTGAYLEHASGKPSLKLYNMLRNGLSLGVHSAINQAKKEHIPVRKENLQVINNGRANFVNIDVLPIGDSPSKAEYYLLLFEKYVPEVMTAGNNDGSAGAELEKAIQRGQGSELIRMEHELTATKEYLRAVIDKHEFANEQLRAANEEIQSSNEELQSMNEELETAKEELQSSNEELVALNDEVQNRNLELGIVSSDLYNLFRSINIPVLILRDNLQIRRFNPAAEAVFNLINTDIGRPITNINTNFNNSDLERAIREVIYTPINKEYEVQDRFGCWYAVQIRPYKTTDNRIDGVVITFINIDSIKKSLAISQEALEYAEAIIDTVREPLLVLDANMHVERANKAFYQTFMVTPEEALNKSIFNLGNGQWNITPLRDLLENTLNKNTVFRDFEVAHDFPHIGYKKMLVNARPVAGQNNQIKLILIAIDDITEQ